MWMQQRLGLKLTQKPVLTQSLRQLVKLLALNKLDLKEEINQELLGNPALELTEPGSGPEGESQEEEESRERARKPDEPTTAASESDREGVDAVTHTAAGPEKPRRPPSWSGRARSPPARWTKSIFPPSLTTTSRLVRGRRSEK